MRNPTVSRSLFEPTRAGDIELANRIVMAPLTRDRAGAGRVPTPLMAEYYAQRADAGLIVAEGTQISPEGQGYLDTPGIYSAAQVKGWKAVTDGVHARGGRIVLQLWHVGRVSHVSLQAGGKQPVAPSAIRAKTKTFTAAGFEDVSEPRALDAGEMPRLVNDYRRATELAMDAGFDGVEVHAANGYLIDQFMRDGSNRRQDAWGGSIDNRTRLLREAVAAVASVAGAGRTGVRFSPVTPSNDIRDSRPQALFERAVDHLAPLGLAYIHVVEGATGGDRHVEPFDYAALRARFGGTWMANNGYDTGMANAALASGYADLIAFGRSFISNPDLVRRLREGAPLNKLNPATLYGGGAEGYTDYPAL
ncbi:N-ethylmaleimide reductase [Luteibacter rhizovicinus]|uniref:N-ethylmaleimide reductase n=1 Tax=Luteibacter rhizovicinus TaxID=242606 RepID=A0A4V2W3T2_9GAMM|nr:alkene reductase [Luteibacter rhizovicinus]TCV93239.1 N-ethylmaleimide reductase [Luteibacter rhizovicinus]